MSLELARTVNDALQNGDSQAAFAVQITPAAENSSGDKTSPSDTSSSAAATSSPLYPFDIPGMFPVATRRADEDAFAFWRRATEEYLSNVERAREVTLNQHVAHLQRDTPLPPYVATGRKAALWDRYHASAQSLNDAEKRAILLHHVQEGSESGQRERSWTVDNFRRYVSYGDPEAFRELLAPLVPQLWESYDRTLHAVIRAERASDAPSHDAQPRSWSDELQYPYWQFRNVVDLLFALDGGEVDLAMIQRALKARSQRRAREFEEKVLARKLDVFPASPPGAKDAWQLDERYDALLEHLATRVSRWPLYEREQGAGQLATGFYRRATPEARQRCLQFTVMAGDVRPALFSCLGANNDLQTWAELLCAPLRYGQGQGFLQLWQKWRNAPNTGTPGTREPALQALLGALPRSPNEQSTALMLKMLNDLTPQERADHVAIWAETLEHPQPRLAKWAFEALLKTPYAKLDWERSIEVAGEKLWSEIMGLAKVAARFLGKTPAEHAPLAWDKLSDALELENTALVEAILRAMIALAAKNKGLRLADAAQEHLVNMAQLAPERFGPLQRRLAAKAPA